MASTVPNQPRPLHNVQQRSDWTFLGSAAARDYYITSDGRELRMVTAKPGHKIVTNQGIDTAILNLLSWGEHGMANRIRAARAMMS